MKRIFINSEKEIQRYLCKFYYIGSKVYFGSQRQHDKLSIEECIISALKKQKYLKDVKTSQIEFASRTDKLVSAKGAAFSFLTRKIPILMEINTTLPQNIGLWGYSKVPMDYLSRYNAIYRHYKYIVPMVSSYNIEIMRDACKILEGRHDFINFSRIKLGEDIKTIRDMDLVKLSVINDFFIFDFKSRAFLRQQIRRMVKKVLEVGAGEIGLEEFKQLLNPLKRISYQPSEAMGLILWDIRYKDQIKFFEDPKSIKRMKDFFIRKIEKHKLKYQLFRALQQDNFSQ